MLLVTTVTRTMLASTARLVAAAATSTHSTHGAATATLASVSSASTTLQDSTVMNVRTGGTETPSSRETVAVSALYGIAKFAI